jgi:PleD family two-component response regulator
MWRRFGQSDAGKELPRVADSTDPDVKALAWRCPRQMSDAWKSMLQRQRSPEEHLEVIEVMNHVLVIDDDHVLVGLLREFLAAEGFTVDVTYDYATGLAGALDGEHELVVLDGMLPGG